MNESYEHLIIYIDIVKNWLRNKNVQDYSKFELALSHDRPHFIKWDYSLEKPTIEYLEKEFKIDLTAPRKIQKLELEYIYINNTELLKNPTKRPIYYNINGDIIEPSNLDLKNTEAVKPF